MDKLGAILGHTKAIQPPKNVPQAPVTPIDWEAAVGSRIATKAQPHRLERELAAPRRKIGGPVQLQRGGQLHELEPR